MYRYMLIYTYTCTCIYMLYTKVVIYVVTDTGCIDMCVYRQTYTHTYPH